MSENKVEETKRLLALALKLVQDDSPIEVEKEATLLLQTLERPGEVLTRKCKRCEEVFQTNYAFKAYCTTSCLRESLEDLGLIWNKDRTMEERWGGEPPSTIKPETLKKLIPWALEVVDTYRKLTRPTTAILERPVVPAVTPEPEPEPDAPTDDLDFDNLLNSI